MFAVVALGSAYAPRGTRCSALFGRKCVSSIRANPSDGPGERWLVFCDLDGVLCDFDEGVRARFGGQGIPARLRATIKIQTPPPILPAVYNFPCWFFLFFF